MSTPITFPALDSSISLEETWPKFEHAVLNYAKGLYPKAGPLGLVLSIIPQARAVALFGQAAFDLQQIPTDPGPRPALVTAAEQRAYEIWKEKDKKFDAYTLAVASLYRAYCAAVEADPVTSQTMCDITTGYISHATSEALHTALKAEYGTLTMDGYESRLAQTYLAWDPSRQTMQQYYSSHSAIYLSLGSAGYPTPDINKMLSLRKGVTNSPRSADFHLCIKQWEAEFPATADRTFANLGTALVKEASTHRNQSAGQLGYAAAVQHPDTAALILKNQQLERQLAARTSVALAATPSDSDDDWRFCHTHGWVNSHAGTGCSNKLPGHNDHAPDNSIPLIKKAHAKKSKQNTRK